MIKFLLFLSILGLGAQVSWAEEVDSSNLNMEKFSILGEKEELSRVPGSAHLVNKKELEKFQHTDIHQVLRSVPGVNIQEEDAFGLRPNIGIRGAHPHRSKKITLLEDGVPISPAPYAAPGSYYFPILNKFEAVEVFKGPMSSKYGPNSIGGAVNLVSKRMNEGAEVGITYGSFNFQKYELGFGVEAFGNWTLDFYRASSDGFKELSHGEGTGFVRQNILARWDKSFTTKNQTISIKANWASEDSNETYLGLAESDFSQNPYQRYEASQDDDMAWEHRQLMFHYSIQPTENLEFELTAYRNEFDRSWNKFDRFRDKTVSVSKLLREPSTNDHFFNVIKGKEDSNLGGGDDIKLTDKSRKYVSNGTQLETNYEFSLGDSVHQLSLSLRMHTDDLEKGKSSSYFQMKSSQLVATADAIDVSANQYASAKAQTVFLYDDVTLGAWNITGGARYEDVNYEYEGTPGVAVNTRGTALAPGFGVYHQTFQKSGFLAGVHKGITLVGPGQSSSIKSEEALNYEFGYRYSNGFGLEVIGFYSDYKNILGTCTQSSGCGSDVDLGTQFNGGKAEVLGVEMATAFSPTYESLSFPIRIAMTYTEAVFKNDFTSDLSEWGKGAVKVGDPIPYIPEFQMNLNAGVVFNKWKIFLNTNYLSSMFDQAVASGRKKVSDRFVFDSSVHYQVVKNGNLFFRADNILGEDYLVSYRPSGLRPGKPQTFMIGGKYIF